MTPKDFVIRYEKALATQQWDHVEPLIHPNCSVTFSNGTFHQGKEAVREAFQRNFALIEDEAYSISDLHWTFKDHNFAVFTYSFKWSGKINGKNASGNGRGTSTLKNEHGTWQLVSEHLGPKS
ncbi:MAG: nuclear transport factor 2 family protein [Verrucomicrobiota bacterium]